LAVLFSLHESGRWSMKRWALRYHPFIRSVNATYHSSFKVPSIYQVPSFNFFHHVYSHFIFAVVHRSQSLFQFPIFTPWICTISSFVLRFQFPCHDFSFSRNFYLHLIFALSTPHQTQPTPSAVHQRVTGLPTLFRIILFAEIIRSSPHHPPPLPFSSRAN
jgi:hypothetical protein